MSESDFTDTDKLQRTGSTESLNNFDVYEENILSSLFQGIPMQHVLALQKSHEELQNIKTQTNTNKCNIIDISNLSDSDNITDSDIDIPKLNCVNVINTPPNEALKTKSHILMKTGFRVPDEIRIIFKQRPLGIQIKPHNIHGFGAKISKVNPTVLAQGVKPNMIITGLNNKDLLGCTFDQIMNVIKNSNLPITLRLKSIDSSKHITKKKYTNKSQRKHYTNNKPIIKHKSLPICTEIGTETQTALTVPSTKMLQSFSAENMPISTVLSSSSDEEEPQVNNCNVIEEDEEESESEINNNSYVNWNNIRLGASVIKYGWGLEVNGTQQLSDDNDVTFELAYDALTRQGLNIYEIRAAIRLIRQQPEQIPPLEIFDKLTINNENRVINSSINPKFMPQQWLKETNLNDAIESESENESESESESEGNNNSVSNDIGNMNVSNEYKFNGEIKGYIDFFDDNDSCDSEESESNSISKSIKVEQMFEVIGLKSPPIENIIGTLCPSIGNENENENENIKHKFDTIEQMLAMDTPINEFDGSPINLFNIIEENESGQSESDNNNFENESEFEYNMNSIGISSYICTEGADMMENDCIIPQVMVKYVKNNSNRSINGNNNHMIESDASDSMSDQFEGGSQNGQNAFIKVKNIVKNQLKNININSNSMNKSIGLLTIKTKAKSLLNKISPKNTPSNHVFTNTNLSNTNINLSIVNQQDNKCKDAKND